MDEIEKLKRLYGKLPEDKRAAMKKFNTVFEFEITDEKTGEHLDKTDIEILFENEDKNKTTMKKNRKEVEEKPERKEIEMPNNVDIIVFNDNDTFIGWLKSKKKINFGQGDKDVYIVIDKDEKEVEKAMPTNVNLMKKLSVIEATKGFGCPIEVTQTGETYKGTNGTAKVFKVFDSWSDETGSDDLPF